MIVLRRVDAHSTLTMLGSGQKRFSNIASFVIKDLQLILEKQNTILIIQKPLESKTYKRFWGIIRKSAKVVYELLKRASHAVQISNNSKNPSGGI
jgi:hypothetical protein